MKAKRLLIASGLILGAIHLSAQDTAVYLSLKQTCLLGIENNVNVQNAALEQEKTHYQLKESQSKLYPQIEGYSTFGYYYAIPKMIVPGEIFGQTGLIPIEIGTTFDWSSGFKASQVLYNQSYFTSLKLARQTENLSKLSLERQKEELVYQISQVYFLCQNTSRQIELLSKTLSNAGRLLAISKLQSDNGVIRKTDYSRIQVNKSNLLTQIDNLKQLYQQQTGLLKYLIHIEPSHGIILTDSLLFEQEQVIHQQLDFNNRIEVQQLDKQKEIILLSNRSNTQSYLPALSAFGQYYFQGQRNEFDFFKKGEDKFYKVGMFGLSLNVPIFDGFEKRSRSRQLAVELMQLQNTRKNTLEYFSKEYSDAVGQFNNNYNALLRQKENIIIAEDTYNINLQGYQQQVVSLSDLLLSESSLVEARMSFYNAVMQLRTAELDVKKAKGELLNFIK